MLNQNNIYHNQIDTYINQINDLSKIIKNKDNLINALKEKEMNIKQDNKSLNKNDNDFYNENMKKLIDDNKKNKLRIELLNDKLKTFDIIQNRNGFKSVLDASWKTSRYLLPCNFNFNFYKIKVPTLHFFQDASRTLLNPLSSKTNTMNWLIKNQIMTITKKY